MGNANSIINENTVPETSNKLKFRDLSISSFVEKLSGRTFTSNSIRSTYSVSRPWSRVSRKGWRESTLTDPFESIKTAWPVPFIESLFLPDFKINFTDEHKYEVLYLISKGAYGKVYKVLKRGTEEIYAMKVLSKSQIIHENCINQVKDEVKIQTMCGHHPFIADAPQYWQNRRKLFIVNTYVEGGDMLNLTNMYGSLPQDICQIYIAELALALDFLHNAGVIYRDLKPENILLDANGHAVLIDFGLSKWLKYGNKTKTICGTLQYIAPEVFSMEGYGHAVDWWSLGVLATYLLTSEYPCSGNTSTPGKLEDVGLSVAARDLIGRLLQPDPTKRLRSLLTLKTIPFFMGFNFDHARAKKIHPKNLFEMSFPDGPKIEMNTSNVLFLDFDQMIPTLV
ncbi:serine/threonine-protein kinase S6KL [Cimex lectularius]|uniref:Protein kinase domain-containing protein n=1 Tax=Cimex lectularius TaxID=79782 RepID=A0A8I6RZ72_CIMLE|nr:serine/threonine-protein kinase S6KL [Cimex lectularius]